MALSAPATTVTATPFTSSPTATVPMPAFTTPFPQPTSCSSVLTTTVRYYSGYGTTSSRTLLLPDTSDPRYVACLNPAGQFTFSPAVCPQGWIAWWLGQTNPPPGAPTISNTVYLSTAYCCAPNYSMPQEDIQNDPSPSCRQAFTTTTSTSGDVLVSTWTLSLALLPAWHISWQPTDVPTLSPQPPVLEGERITQWVPGTDLKPQPRDNWGGGISNGLFFSLVIEIPLLVVAAVVACIFGCRARGGKIRPRSRGGGGGGGGGAAAVEPK